MKNEITPFIVVLMFCAGLLCSTIWWDAKNPPRVPLKKLHKKIQLAPLGEAETYLFLDEKNNPCEVHFRIYRAYEEGEMVPWQCL